MLHEFTSRARHYDTWVHARIPKFTFVALFTVVSAPYCHVLKADIVCKMEGIQRKLISYFFLLQKKHALVENPRSERNSIQARQ